MAFPFLSKKILKVGVRRYSNCIHLNDVYILSAARTPIGSFQGSLSSLNIVQLGSKALVGALEKSGLNPDDVQEFVLGCCFPAGSGQFPAQQIGLLAGLSDSVVVSEINKLCGSGIKALISGCQAITSNTHEVVVTGGAESTSNVPYILKRKSLRFGHICLRDLLINDGFNDMFEQVDVTHFAEQSAKEYGFTREMQDDYALTSYERAAKAQSEGTFDDEIVPVVVQKAKGKEEETVCFDEEVGRLNLEKFRTLVPDIGKEGTITAGNASGLQDGAAMLVLASGNYVLKKNLRPLARIVSYSESCMHRKKFVVAPSVAIPKALVKANLGKESISMWEISETFALVPLINIKLLNLKPETVNIHGGAVSLGHPFGMTGVRIVGHLALKLNPGEFGCAAMCHGGGGGCAIVIQKMAF